MIREMTQPAYDDATDSVVTPKAQAAPEAAPQDERQLRVVLAAMKVMYDPKTSDGIVKMLHIGEPAQALAQTAVFVLRLLLNQSQGRLPPDVLLASVERVVGLLAELAQAAGIQLDPQMVAQVTQAVMQGVQQKLQGGQQPGGGAAQPNMGMGQPKLGMGAGAPQGIMRQAMTGA